MVLGVVGKNATKFKLSTRSMNLTSINHYPLIVTHDWTNTPLGTALPSIVPYSYNASNGTLSKVYTPSRTAPVETDILENSQPTSHWEGSRTWWHFGVVLTIVIACM